jgi:predicted RNase H-like nuclease (RuvC/YqgF family)
VRAEKAETERYAESQRNKCDQLGFAQKRYISDIHECNEALREEHRVVEEKEKVIRGLERKIQELNGVIIRKNEEITGFQSRLQSLLAALAARSQRREVQTKGDARYEKLRFKYKEIEEMNVLLKEQNAFLAEHNKVLKSQLSAESGNRVNSLLKQIEALRAENAELKRAAEVPE